jgi:hypothetical protein
LIYGKAAGQDMDSLFGNARVNIADALAPGMIGDHNRISWSGWS